MLTLSSSAEHLYFVRPFVYEYRAVFSVQLSGCPMLSRLNRLVAVSEKLGFFLSVLRSIESIGYREAHRPDRNYPFVPLVFFRISYPK